MAKETGALPDHMIRKLMEGSFINGASFKNVMPASINLSMSDEVYRIEEVFQPKPGEAVRDILPEIGSIRVEPATIFERGVNYLARLNESLKLPDLIYGYCNPRSSVGRNDILVRVIGDGSSRYDAAEPGGYKGNLWILINSKSYPVRIPTNQTLAQLRLFTQDTRFSELDLQVSFEKDKLLWRREGQPFLYDDIKVTDRDGSVILTVDLEGDILGWECTMGSSSILDFSLKNHYQPEKFFRPLRKTNGDRIVLEQGGFYILYTAERVRIPPHLACEMVAMDARSGEFRSHYAGFIDPGWGYGKNGEGKGRRLVLEVRPFERIIFRHKQPAAKIRFERMQELPDNHYDDLPTSSYTTESNTPRLSSHFKEV